MSKVWNFLKEKTSESTTRVILFLVSIPVATMLYMVSFYIFWFTIHPTEIFYMGLTQTPTVVQHSIDWVNISAFVAAVLTGFLALLWGKKMNKDAENREPPNPPTP